MISFPYRETLVGKLFRVQVARRAVNKILYRPADWGRGSCNAKCYIETLQGNSYGTHVDPLQTAEITEPETLLIDAPSCRPSTL